MRVFDCCSGQCTHTLTGHPRTPWTIQFHPSNNNLLASGCLGGQVRIWDLDVCMLGYQSLTFVILIS